MKMERTRVKPQRMMENDMFRTEYYLDRMAGGEASKRWGATKLMDCVMSNNLKAVEAELKNSPNVNASDFFGRTAFIDAARLGNTGIMERLADVGAKVDAIDVDDNGSLFFATEFGHFSAVKFLVNKDVDINAINIEGITALMRASLRYVEIAFYLLENDAIAYLVDNDFVSSLMNAARSGHSKLMRALMEKGADPKGKDRLGRGVIGYAAESKKPAPIDVLVSAGAVDVAALGDYRMLLKYDIIELVKRVRRL